MELQAGREVGIELVVRLVGRAMHAHGDAAGEGDPVFDAAVGTVANWLSCYEVLSSAGFDAIKSMAALIESKGVVEQAFEFLLANNAGMVRIEEELTVQQTRDISTELFFPQAAAPADHVDLQALEREGYCQPLIQRAFEVGRTPC